MERDDLFSEPAKILPEEKTVSSAESFRTRPLAARMRPRNLDEYIGQTHILAPGQLLRRAIEADRIQSLIFYGPPGTGKTHTIHYLASTLPEHTTLIIAAEECGSLGRYFALARVLQPSMIVIEDVDLIARHRGDSYHEGTMLNVLLNEMDGLREDADVLVVLTTNRPEKLEPALAQRPGRIDQAIEFPLPDETGRAKLLKLYACGLSFSDELAELIVARTSGTSAAFIKELMRRAAQFSFRAGKRWEIGQRGTGWCSPGDAVPGRVAEHEIAGRIECGI